MIHVFTKSEGSNGSERIMCQDQGGDLQSREVDMNSDSEYKNKMSPKKEAYSRNGGILTQPIRIRMRVGWMLGSGM